MPRKSLLTHRNMALLAAIAVFFFALAFKNRTETRDYQKNLVSTRGRVKEVKITRGPGNVEWRYTAVEVVYGTQRFVFIEKLSDKPHKIDDQVPVVFDRRNPKDTAKIGGPEEIWRPFFILLSEGLAFLALALVFLIRMMKIKKS